MIRDKSDWSTGGPGRVVLINVFTPKEGMAEEFVRVQTGEYVRLKGKVAGAIGNRLHRSLDGKKIVNYALFESMDAYKAWRESDLFEEHRKIIAPLVEKSEPELYTVSYESETIPAAFL